MWWRAALAAVSAGAVLLPVSPALVEGWYSNGVYPLIQRGLTSLSNLLPFALFDVAIVGVPAWLVWRTVDDHRAGSNGWRALAGRALLRAATTAMVSLVSFMVPPCTGWMAIS